MERSLLRCCHSLFRLSILVPGHVFQFLQRTWRSGTRSSNKLLWRDLKIWLLSRVASSPCYIRDHLSMCTMTDGQRQSPACRRVSLRIPLYLIGVTLGLLAYSWLWINLWIDINPLTHQLSVAKFYIFHCDPGGCKGCCHRGILFDLSGHSKPRPVKLGWHNLFFFPTNYPVFN